MTNDDMLQKIKYYMVRLFVTLGPFSVFTICLQIKLFSEIRSCSFLSLLRLCCDFSLWISHLYTVIWALVLCFLDCNLSDLLFLQGHSNVKLQLAATFCISNLIWNEEDGT